MNIQPLVADRLAATQQVAADLFPWENEHAEALVAAVEPAAHERFCAARRLRSVRCWTAHRGANQEVLGLAALYAYEAQSDEAWLAWFGLRTCARGLGAGAKVLDWVIDLARAEGRRTLRLWTTDEAEYACATRLYRVRGFVPETQPSLPGESWETVVFSLGLDGSSPRPWSMVSPQGELCGRVAPVPALVAA